MVKNSVCKLRNLKFGECLFGMIRIIFFLIYMFIFYVLFFKETMNIYVPANRINAPSNKILLIGVILLIAISVLGSKYLGHKFKLNFYKSIILVTSLVYVIQIFILYHIVFYTGWDCGTIRDLAYSYIYNGTMDPRYLSINPNNIFMECITIAGLKIFSFLGNFDAMHFAMICVMDLVMNISICLVAVIAYKITGNRFLSFIGYFCLVILVALSPWIVIPYTDTASIIFPIGILYIYLEKDCFRSNFLFWFVLSSIGVIGYFIKPTCIIMLIAIIIVNLLKIQHLEWKKCVLSIMGVLISTLIISAGNSYIKYRMDLDQELNLTWAHYIMMGMNQESWGVWNQEDFDFSLTIDGKEERYQKDLSRLKERIQEYGVSGVILQMQKKTLINFNDGSFAWGNEGNFYATPNSNDSKISNFLKSIFYQNEQGTRYKYLFGIQHFIWLFVLILSLFCCFKIAGSLEVKYVILLALIGIVVFVTLFEARGRYIFNYVPIFVLAAICGMENVINIGTKEGL